MPPLRRLYRRPGGGFLCLSQENLEDWVGDALATSTNRRLEGVLRRNWWGFAGRRSADAALHARAGDFLVQACRNQASELAFGATLVTAAGPHLQAQHVLHTAVPSHPAGRDPRPLPQEQAEEIVDAEHAELLLGTSYAGVISAAASLGAQSLCCPAIGCGCRGYPLDTAARIGLRAVAGASAVPYVEVRFWERRAFDAWEEAVGQASLQPCAEQEAMDALWGGEPLALWQERKQRAAEAARCTVL